MNVKFPFGKYRGSPIRAVPRDYLEWLSTTRLKPWMRRAVKEELELRAIREERPQPTPGGNRPGEGRS